MTSRASGKAAPGRGTSAGIRRLWLALSSAWALAWIAGIGVFSFVTIGLGRELHSQELDAQLALYATATYGMAWFDQEGAFHEEVFQREEDMVTAPVDIWVVEPGEPPTVHLRPAQPLFALDSLGVIAGRVVVSGEELQVEGHDTAGVPYRLHATPTFQDGRTTEARAAILVVGDSRATARSQAAFTAQVLLLALALGLAGLGVGIALARWSLRPLVQALAQRERFLSAAAHELRTPIASLQAICDSARAGDEPAERALARALPLAQETARVVDGLLLFARLDAGAGELERRSLRLDLLVEACLPEKPSIPLDARESVVSADDRLVRVALRNLLENALQHGAARAVRVVVSGTSVVVEDGGPGFPEAVLALNRHAFSLAPSHRGAGIGLATAKLIARLHGGDLELANPTAGGARATLRLARQ